jgi:hypothetical protein
VQIFPTMRYAQIHQQRAVFDIREYISKIIILIIQTVSMCIHASFTHRLLVFGKKIKSLISGGISKFPKLIVFGQILAILGGFGQIWTDSAALLIANCMLFDGKTLTPHNSKIGNPKITCCNSLESYDPYLLPQKVPENSHEFAVHSNMPKIQKAIFGH